MKKQTTSKQLKERGTSIVTFLVIVPFLLIFAFLIVDLGRVAILSSAVDNASLAVCRYYETTSTASQDILKEKALAAGPSLYDGDLSVSVVKKSPVSETYTHHFYEYTTDKFIDRPSTTTTQNFTVEVSFKGDYMTPVGVALAQIGGRYDGKFVLTSKTAGVLDTTVEGGGW